MGLPSTGLLAAGVPGLADGDHVLLDHGSGGLLSHDLVTRVVAGALGDVHVGEMEDSRVLDLPPGRLAMTTDSFVIDPPFFHGGNIGNVAVCGTVNDLAVSGADPLYLTLALVLEEGLPLADLVAVLHGVRDSAREAGVSIVAGDTKVVRRGEVDKVFLNTAGVGVLRPGAHRPSASLIRPGDAVVVTGELGNHSVHVLSLRHGLGFESRIPSDCAPLNHLVRDLLDAFGPAVRFLRDITRGGLGTLLNEVRAEVGRAIEVEQRLLPIRPETAMAADMLGVSPIYLANEGNLCAFVAPEAAGAVVARLRQHPYGRHAAVVGSVLDDDTDAVLLRTADGQLTTVEFLAGAELPRLC